MKLKQLDLEEPEEVNKRLKDKLCNGFVGKVHQNMVKHGHIKKL